MAVKFQEGWQKKTGQQQLRDVRKAFNEKAKLAEKTRFNSAKATQKATGTKQAASVKKPVSPGKDVPETLQNKRPETQDQASRLAHAKEAAKQHVNDRDAARNLKALQTKSSTPARSETATRKAVTAKADPQSAHVKTQDGKQTKQPVADQATQVATQLAKKPVELKPRTPEAKQPEKGKAKGGKKAKAAAKGKVQDAESAARMGTLAQNAALAGAQGVKGGLEIERTGLDDVESEDEGLEEEQDRDASTFAKGAGRKRTTENKLDGVLSGFSGDTAGEEAEAETAALDVSGAMNKEELPETDPEFHVYSEFDTTAPGVEHVKGKAKVFERLVEKRIGEIAKLNREIEGKIKNIFETTPLSERIVGELGSDLNAADFITSVYGGISG